MIGMGVRTLFAAAAVIVSTTSIASAATFADVTFDPNNRATSVELTPNEPYVAFGSGGGDTFGDPTQSLGDLAGLRTAENSAPGDDVVISLGDADTKQTIGLGFGGQGPFTFTNFTVFENGGPLSIGPFAEAFEVSLKLNDGFMTSAVYRAATGYELYDGSSTNGAASTTFLATDFGINSTTLVDMLYISNILFADRSQYQLDFLPQSAFDPDITFVVLDTAIAPIPVPAALPLLAGALGLLGFTARRKRTAA